MSLANQANAPIVEDDEFLSRIVDDIGLVQLLCSVVHITGNLDIIDGVESRMMLFSGDGSGQIPGEQAKTLRARALDAITAWRDSGCPEPYRPDDAELHRMFEFLIGVKMGGQYTALIKEEMGYDGDTRRYVWPAAVPDEAKAANPVLIIGGGMSGLVLALRLKQAGIPVTVIEKNPGAGGTWHENRYPGCRVDVASHSYSFSFTQDYRWPTLFSSATELQRYFDAFVERFDLRDVIRFQTEVVRADYDEQAHEWAVRLRDANGTERVERARSLVSAVGQLNLARIPDFEGLDSFAGRYWHTSGWPGDVDLAGKRVVVIGAAATGVQAIPQIAAVAAHTTVMMRSPNWMSINPEYKRPIRDSEQWAFEHLPYFAGWTRTLYFNWPFDLDPSRFKIDPGWTGGEPGKLSTSAANEMSRVRLTGMIEGRLKDDPALAAKLVPTYPPYMKRPIVVDGDYLDALQRDNVDVVTDGIARIVPDGVVDSGGTLHAADYIVFATGFHAQKFLHPMDIHGRGGVALNAYWGDEPGGLYGMTVPQFPNFYMMYGPNTNLGFNGTLIFNSECQAGYITACIGRMIAEELDEIEVREEAYRAYNDRVQDEIGQFVWTLEHTNNWFKSATGRITTNSPWSCVQYWQFTREPDRADFVAAERPEGEPPPNPTPSSVERLNHA